MNKQQRMQMIKGLNKKVADNICGYLVGPKSDVQYKISTGNLYQNNPINSIQIRTSGGKDYPELTIQLDTAVKYQITSPKSKKWCPIFQDIELPQVIYLDGYNDNDTVQLALDNPEEYVRITTAFFRELIRHLSKMHGIPEYRKLYFGDVPQSINDSVPEDMKGVLKDDIAIATFPVIYKEKEKLDTILSVYQNRQYRRARGY